MSFYYSRWRSLTGVEALFSECFAGDDYYVFCAQDFDRAVLDKALGHDLLTGNDKARLQGYENLLCWNGDVLNALRMVLAHVRVYAGRGLYHMDLNCENIMFSGEEVEFVDCEYVLREPVFLSRVLGFKAALLKSYRSIFIAVD